MKKTLLAICTLLIVSCSKKEEKSEQKNIQEEKQIVENTTQSIEKLQILLSQFEDKSQFFDISALKPSLVKGKKGTIIHIVPNNLELENGKAIGNKLKIELKELTNQKDLFKNNVQTISNGKLLVSGGSYFIDITSNGEKVKLKKGKTLAIKFPKITNRNMELFYGERDALNQMNWTTTNTKFRNQIPTMDNKYTENETELIFTEGDVIIENLVPKKDVKKVNTIENAIYESVQLIKLGWINCDAFYNKPTEKLALTFNGINDLKFVSSYIIFKDINSFMNHYTYKNTKLESEIILPLNHKVKIISFSYKDDKFYVATKEVTTSKNGSVELDLKEVSEKNIEKLFKI